MVETHFAELGTHGSGLTEHMLPKLRENIQVLQEAFHAAKQLLKQIFIIWFEQILHESNHVYPKKLNQSEDWVMSRKSQS